MNTWLLVLGLAALVAQEPGNPGHKPPPADYYCETHGADAAHTCACQRRDVDPLCEGFPIEDNVRCRVACHPTHCHCQVVCDPLPQ